MKKDRVKEISMESMVGAFMFTVLLALGVLTIFLSRENFFAKKYFMEVNFEEVQGLRQGDNVLTRGVVIGRVKALYIQEDGVQVLLSLDTTVKLHEDYSIQIVPSSVLGGQHLSIDVGTLGRPLLADGAVVRGVPPVDLVEEASRTFQSVREALVDGGILENLKSTMEQVNGITARLEKGEGTLGKLLTDEAVYGDLEEIAANLKDISHRMSNGEGTFAKLLSDDDTIYKNMEAITENLREVSDRLADGKGTLGKLLSEEDTLYEDLSASASAIKDISQSITKGEGTLGKLAKDDELYQEAMLLLREIRAAVDDIRETAPITTFTSVFFGAF